MLGETLRGAASYLLPQALSLTPLEKELQEADSESTLFHRYGKDLTVPTDAGTVRVHVVQVPQPDERRIESLPPVVLVHGMGGQISCFRQLAQDLSRFCCVIAIDLPGHGKSPDPANWNATGPDISVQIVQHVIREACGDAPFVIVGHSYGCCHALRLALQPQLVEQCKAVVVIEPPFRPELWMYQRLIARWIPPLAFDIGFRSKDRKGELHSPSVNRSVAKSASDEVRRQQLQINLQSKSLTVLQTLSRMTFFNPETEGRPKCPMLVVSGSEDQVCPAPQVRALSDALGERAQYAEVPAAGHSVLFEQPEIISGVISHFLGEYVDERLSLSWQLQYIASREDKWSLKNEKKWLQTDPVGTPVGSSFLCGMKVLRQNDAVHGPLALEKGHPEIRVVIDISRESPPYDPSSFERIKYFKFPTVSKIPPSKPEVAKFIKLINSKRSLLNEGELIAVHCHYGFNRTGFFICSYLIEELNYTVGDAVAAYAKARPPGIKHSHFVDELHLRYNSPQLLSS